MKPKNKGQMMVSDTISSRTVSVLAAVALPPPIHGQSIANMEIVRRLAASCEQLCVVDTAPRTRDRSIAYHLKRAIQVLYAARKMIGISPSVLRSLYTVLEAGSGIIYNFILIVFARCLGYRIIFHHHSSAHILREKLSFRLLSLIGGTKMVHVVLSHAMSKDLAARYPRVRRVLVCNNAGYVLNPQRRPPRNVKGRPLVVGLLSNLNREKGLDTVVETIAAGRAAGLDLKLVLAGPLIGRAAIATVELAGRILGSALDVRGPVEGEAKSAFYECIDVFFFPTNYIYEAQPLVIFEAMSYGVPVIAADRGYIAEMIGSAGTVVPRNLDIVDTIITILRTFIEHPEELNRARKASRKQFLAMRAKAMAEIEELVDAILSPRIDR